MEILCIDPAGWALYDLDVLVPIWRAVPFSWELSLPTFSREAVCLVTGPKREHGLAWELLTIKEFIFLSPSLFPSVMVSIRNQSMLGNLLSCLVTGS